MTDFIEGPIPRKLINKMPFVVIPEGDREGVDTSKMYVDGIAPSHLDAFDSYARYKAQLPVMERLWDIAERSGRWNDPRTLPQQLTPRDFAGVFSMLTHVSGNTSQLRQELAEAADGYSRIKVPFMENMTELLTGYEEALHHVASSCALLADPSTIVASAPSALIAELFNAEDADEPLNSEDDLRMPSNISVIIPSAPMQFGAYSEQFAMWATCFVVHADADLRPTVLMAGIQQNGHGGMVLTDMGYRLRAAAQLLAWGSWDETKAEVDITRPMKRKEWRAGLTKITKSADWLTYRTLNMGRTTRSQEPSSGTDRHVKAHFRRGHWRRSRVGPRDDWTYVRHFIRPVIVGTDDISNIQRPVYRGIK